MKILHRDVKPALGELRDDLLGSFWVKGEVGCWVILRAANNIYIYMKQVDYFLYVSCHKTSGVLKLPILVQMYGKFEGFPLKNAFVWVGFL